MWKFWLASRGVGESFGCPWFDMTEFVIQPARARLDVSVSWKNARQKRFLAGLFSLHLHGERRYAVGIDAEEAHAVVGPEVPADARLHARLDEPHNEVAAQRLAP